MSPLQLPLLFNAVFCEPIALEITTFHAIAAFLLPRMSGQVSAADLGDLMAADKPHTFGHRRAGMATPRLNQDGSVDGRYYNTLVGREDVAIIPACGVMAKGAGIFQEVCYGMVSHDRISHATSQALAAPAVKKIAFDWNSPGGQVVGTPELASIIKMAGQVKPTYAFVDNMMASAAVYAGIQANETYITPSARIGSIGTIMGILDDSMRMKMAGLEMHTFSAGKHKALGSSGRVLTDDDRAYLQSIVNHANAGFVQAVQDARPGVAKEVLTDAKVYTGKQAVGLGLVDGLVNSWDEFVSLL